MMHEKFWSPASSNSTNRNRISNILGFFRRIRLLHQTALIAKLIATRAVVSGSNPQNVAFMHIYVYRLCIDNFISNKYVEKMEIYIKLDIHLQFRLLIWGWTLFNILLKLLTSIFTAAVITMITYRTCS